MPLTAAISALVVIFAASDVMSVTVRAGPYCVPPVWMGGRATTLGKVDSQGRTTVKRTFGRYLYSLTQLKMRSDDNVFANGVVQSASLIYDYPDKVLYTITGSNPGTCTKTALPGPFPTQCVPADATVTLANTFYGEGQNNVTVMELSGIQHGFVNYHVTMTQETFVPVYEQLWGGYNGDNFFQALSFYNVTVINQIPDIMFQPPDICNHVPLTASHGKRSVPFETDQVLVFP